MRRTTAAFLSTTPSSSVLFAVDMAPPQPPNLKAMHSNRKYGSWIMTPAQATTASSALTYATCLSDGPHLRPASVHLFERCFKRSSNCLSCNRVVTSSCHGRWRSWKSLDEGRSTSCTKARSKAEESAVV